MSGKQTRRDGLVRRSSQRSWLTAGLLLILAACGREPSPPSTSPLPAPIQHREVIIEGQARGYRVFAPATLAGRRAAPLVLVLHGEGNTAESMVQTTQFDREATAGEFVVAYPEGLERSWNGGFCCGRSLRNGVDDVGFLTRVLDELERDYPIDNSRVFVVGVSSGAIMAYRFACEVAPRIAGVGSVAGAMLLEQCHPGRPVSVIEIHGTADQLVPFEGGTVQPEGVASVPAPPTRAVVERWADLNGCQGPPVSEARGPVTTSTWSQCESGTAVRLAAIDGAGHTWFAPGLGPAAGAVDATREIWGFLSRPAGPTR